MRELLELGNRYARKSSWTDFALVKFCLFSMGLIAGTQIKEKCKKPAICAAIFVFLITYIPLMLKLFGIAANKADQD